MQIYIKTSYKNHIQTSEAWILLTTDHHEERRERWTTDALTSQSISSIRGRLPPFSLSHHLVYMIAGYVLDYRTDLTIEKFFFECFVHAGETKVTNCCISVSSAAVLCDCTDLNQTEEESAFESWHTNPGWSCTCCAVCCCVHNFKKSKKLNLPCWTSFFPL